MTGLDDSDIRLDGTWQLTQATDGGAPLCSGRACLIQNIALEAVTQPGDVFYAPEFGWGLQEFIQSEDDALTRLEIRQRVRKGLLKREVIIPESVRVECVFEDDVFRVGCRFELREGGEEQTLDIIISAVNVEVVV